MPFSTAGMNSFGTEPPTMPLMNSLPLPCAFGSIFSHTWPNWPRPPDCLMCLPSLSMVPRMVSRYATCGLPTLASTLNSRRMRSTMISRCSSPMPEMMVCAGLFVGRHAERRVFLGETLQRQAHLFLVGLGLRLDGDRDDRNRNVHLLERDDLLEIAERVAGEHVLEAHGRGDVAGAHFLDLAALVGVHLQQTPDALFLGLGRHEHRVAGIQRARVHAEEGEIADERIVEDLERQRGERLFVARGARDGFAAVVEALGGRHLDGRRHEFDDGVEQRLHALVLERRAAHAQHDLVLERARLEAALDLVVASARCRPGTCR